MVPRSLVASRIWSQGGYAAVSGLIGRGLFDALKAEAEDARPLGQRTILPISDRTEDRGGSPARALRSAPCGEVHRALHASRQLTDAVAKYVASLCHRPGLALIIFTSVRATFLLCTATS